MDQLITSAPNLLPSITMSNSSPDALRLQHLYTLAFADRMRMLQQPFGQLGHFPPLMGVPPMSGQRFAPPADLAMFPLAKLDPRLFRIPFPEEPKPQHSYIGLISMAILSSPDKKLVLADIYQYILDNPGTGPTLWGFFYTELFLLAIACYSMGSSLAESTGEGVESFIQATGALLMLGNSVCVAAIGVLMHPVLRPHDENVALGYVVSRCAEATELSRQRLAIVRVSLCIAALIAIWSCLHAGAQDLVQLLLQVAGPTQRRLGSRLRRLADGKAAGRPLRVVPERGHVPPMLPKAAC